MHPFPSSMFVTYSLQVMTYRRRYDVLWQQACLVAVTLPSFGT